MLYVIAKCCDLCIDVLCKQEHSKIKTNNFSSFGQVAEWANMTGFLVALGGVCLQRKCPASARQDLGRGGRGLPALPHSAGQDMQYCPVTQFLGHLLR